MVMWRKARYCSAISPLSIFLSVLHREEKKNREKKKTQIDERDTLYVETTFYVFIILAFFHIFFVTQR